MTTFRQPEGMRQPAGMARPGPLASAWPLSSVGGRSRPSHREMRAVRRALNGVTLSPGEPVRILLIEDLSGSMGSIASMREAVVKGLLEWTHRNLGVDDEIAVISFGGDACIRLSPAPARANHKLSDADLRSFATMLGSTWQLVAGFPRTDSTTVAVLISDGLVADLTGSGSRVNAAAAGVDHIALLIPSSESYAGEAPASWLAAFPNDPALVVDGEHGGSLATAIVDVIGTVTGRLPRGIGSTSDRTIQSNSQETS